MKKLPSALLSLLCLALCPVRAEEVHSIPASPPATLTPVAVPVVPKEIAEAEPVRVPETIGITVLAGLGFLMMFGRRRYS